MPKGSPTILLVDDDESFCYSAERSLEQAGFSVLPAHDYQDALVALESDRRIDLLLTDIMMPKGIHGFALARMARMRRLDLKVLYMTAYDVPTVEAVGKVLRKPIDDSELVNEVRNALAGAVRLDAG